ncbi:MAG: lauroyl acyltransferase [Deltaproteobacteria bacterium HGW-Deltaproteobacteria-13]|jgi:lauroyl/myristoyl acyltransferase|nr:MAG: lauroyl acyltransferase [Deltaproteobacteria bacterium HGW-Deltaproteobacteria-13]
MKKLPYKILLYLSHRLGLWFFRIFSWFIATGYFFLFPVRVADSLKFYSALFPDHGFLYHFHCTWKQYHNFTDVYIHRFFPWMAREAEFIREGWEYLDEAVGKKTGAILLMSHIGNWELAAQTLNSKGLPIMLYLGAKHKEQMERVQKENLAKNGIRIVATSEDEKSPFALIEGINFLREGGIVSMAGDRLWGRQSYVPVDFLGYEAHLPDTPHLFALMTGAPLMTFFVYQETLGKYHIKVSKGRKVIAATRADRKKTVQASAQAYAMDLARFASEHPFEWHHFEPFIGKIINK